MKQLLDWYSDDGLQIVTISLIPDWDAWSAASDSLDIPWLNLGDLSDDAPIGNISTTYGRVDFRKNFLVDNKGCILGVDISRSALTGFLVEKYGEASSAN